MADLQQVYKQLVAMGTDPLQKRKTTGVFFTPTDRHDTYDFVDPKHCNMNGRSVIVTGASKGVGRAIAVSYAKAGCSRIGLAARSPLDEIEIEVKEAAKAAGHEEPDIVKLRVDVAKKEDVENAAKEIKGAFGGIDVLINNAGYMEHYVNMMEVEPEDWWKTWEINVYGIFLMSRYFLPLLMDQPSGLKTVVNLTSIWAHTTFAAGSAYQNSKFAVLRLSELLNSNFPPSCPASLPGASDDGLLCYSVQPGSVDTELARGLSAPIRTFLQDTPALPGDSLVWMTSQRREWLRGRYINAQMDMQEFESMKDEVLRDDLLKMKMSVGGGSKWE